MEINSIKKFHAVCFVKSLSTNAHNEDFPLRHAGGIQVIAFLISIQCDHEKIF